jgi:hypothetical protein
MFMRHAQGIAGFEVVGHDPEAVGADFIGFPALTFEHEQGGRVVSTEVAESVVFGQGFEHHSLSSGSNPFTSDAGSCARPGNMA